MMEIDLLCKHLPKNVRWRRWLPLLTLFLLPPSFWSCDDSEEGRNEFISVSHVDRQTGEKIEMKPDEAINIPPKAGELSIFVKTNTDYSVLIQSKVPANEQEKEEVVEDWLKAEKVGRNETTGEDEWHLAWEAQTKDYKRRIATVSITSPGVDYGKFINIRQGFTTRLGEDFEWLKYGSSTASPNVTTNEKLISDWTEAQKEYNWSSTIGKEASKAYCYGKFGFIRLGDNQGHGADLITPYITDIVRDSVLLVSFDAVAYVADDGTKDNNKLTINILNGGEFADTHTATKTIDLNYYDPLDEDILHTMWSKGRHDFYVVSPPERPITANTKIQIIGGDYILTTGNNRVFVDNFYVYRLDNVYYYLLEE